MGEKCNHWLNDCIVFHLRTKSVLNGSGSSLERFKNAKKIIEMAKTQNFRGMPMLATRSSTRSLQSTGNQGFHSSTHTQTTDGHRDLETESAQWANSLNSATIGCMIV